MDTDQPPLERLPLGARLEALALDLVPAFAPVAIAGAVGVIWFDRGSGGRTDLEPAAGIVVLVAAVWPAVYFGRRRTIGKTRVGAWVSGGGVRSRFRGVWALLPTASFAWPFLAPLLAVDAVWARFDRRLALHDRLAGTAVLREVREPAAVRELRRAGAEARRDYARAALDWAIERGASDGHVAEIQSAVDAAPGDPYEAQAAWARATNAVAAPLIDRLRLAEVDDPDFVDPVLESLYEEADAAEDRVRARLVQPRA